MLILGSVVRNGPELPEVNMNRMREEGGKFHMKKMREWTWNIGMDLNVSDDIPNVCEFNYAFT